MAHVLLNKQAGAVFKPFDTLAEQQDPPKHINALTIEDISQFVHNLYFSVQFLVWEQFKFSLVMHHIQGETVQELTERIHYNSTARNFASINNQ